MPRFYLLVKQQSRLQRIEKLNKWILCTFLYIKKECRNYKSSVKNGKKGKKYGKIGYFCAR